MAELLQLLDQPTGVRLAVAAAVPIRSKIAVGLVPLEHPYADTTTPHGHWESAMSMTEIACMGRPRLFVGLCRSVRLFDLSEFVWTSLRSLPVFICMTVGSAARRVVVGERGSPSGSR